MSHAIDEAVSIKSPTWVRLPGVNCWGRRLNATTVLAALHVPAKRYWLVPTKESDWPVTDPRFVAYRGSIAYDMIFDSLVGLDQWIAISWSAFHEAQWGPLP